MTAKEFIQPSNVPLDAKEWGKKHPFKILLVDDEEDCRLQAIKKLDTFGYECDIAHDGLEALEKEGQKRYDLIFMDIIMPNMTGIEASKIILNRYNLEVETRPIIVALTSSGMEMFSQSIYARIDHYISKPLMYKDLQQLLVGIIQNHPR